MGVFLIHIWTKFFKIVTSYLAIPVLLTPLTRFGLLTLGIFSLFLALGAFVV